jgi:phosphomannomutase
MRVDQVEVSWDGGKSRWLIRIVNGEEVVRRYCHLSKDADEEELGAAAQKTVRDEGYEVDPSVVSVRR